MNDRCKRFRSNAVGDRPALRGCIISTCFEERLKDGLRIVEVIVDDIDEA